MQEIIHSLDSIDKQWLLALNNDYPPFWDNVMWLVSQRLTWIPFYLSLMFIILKNWKKEGVWIILGLILCVVIADQIASGVIKNAVHRLRPSQDPTIENMVALVNGYRGGKFGFVSSHAANSFGLAMLSSLFFRNKIFTLAVFIWAALVSYSRIFLGVHYPGDILGGAFVGLSVALLLYFLIKKIRPPLDLKAEKTVIPVLVLAFSLLFLGIYAAILSA